MKQYDTVIFDLDGTLLNTLEDLADSVNHALVACTLPCRTLEEVRQFVGNGVGQLIARAVPDTVTEELRNRCMVEFQSHYLTNMQNKTAPYPGITNLLDNLKRAGVRIGVASNKFDEAVKHLCPIYFGDHLDIAVGESQILRKKPAPDMVLHAMRELSADPARTIYVGDSDVDLETARNANLPCIAVTWGFRSRSFLIEHGAEQLVNDIRELAAFLL